MRGLLLVALGAALIWLGLGRGGTTSAKERDGDEVASERAEARDAAPPRSDWTDRAEGGADTPTTEPSVEPAAAVPVREPDPPEREETRAPAQPDLSLGTSGARREPTGPSDVVGGARGPGLRLGAAATSQLGVALLESWLDRDHERFERFLIEGPGTSIDDGIRQAAASLWQSLTEGPERASQGLSVVERSGHVTRDQVRILKASFGAPGTRVVPVAENSRDDFARAMRIVVLLDEGEAALAAQGHRIAAESFSRAIHLELGAPWAPHREVLLEWGAKLLRAQRHHRLSPEGQWDSFEYEVRPGDNLTVIRRRVLSARPEMLLCTGLMGIVNNAPHGQITAGDRLRFPVDHANVLVDLDARVAVLRFGTEAVQLWDVGIGKEGQETPTGTYVAGTKLREPAYTPVGAEPLPFGHPENPLGTRWIAWNKGGRSTSIGFHGTSDPDGVGERVSKGCVRMRNEDVEELYALLPEGARIIVQP